LFTINYFIEVRGGLPLNPSLNPLTISGILVKIEYNIAAMIRILLCRLVILFFIFIF